MSCKTNETTSPYPSIPITSITSTIFPLSILYNSMYVGATKNLAAALCVNRTITFECVRNDHLGVKFDSPGHKSPFTSKHPQKYKVHNTQINTTPTGQHHEGSIGAGRLGDRQQYGTILVTIHVSVCSSLRRPATSVVVSWTGRRQCCNTTLGTTLDTSNTIPS